MWTLSNSGNSHWRKDSLGNTHVIYKGYVKGVSGNKGYTWMVVYPDGSKKYIPIPTKRAVGPWKQVGRQGGYNKRMNVQEDPFEYADKHIAAKEARS